MRSVTRINRRLVIRIAVGLFILGLISGTAGILLFRNVLRPGQQQRVINILPFMGTFLPRVPENYSLPTPIPVTNGISPEDLLSITFEPPSGSMPTEVQFISTETMQPTVTSTP